MPASEQHWWVWREGWAEVEPGTIPEEGETIYVLDAGEDPMDLIGEILTSDHPEGDEHDWSDDWEPIEGPDDF